MLFLDAKKKLCGKLGISYADIANNDLFTEDDLESYLNEAGIEVWDFALWDFAEHSKSGTLTSAEITAKYVAHPEDIAPSSIWLLRIGGKTFDKRNFKPYQRYFEENSNAQDRLWAEHKRLIFFNTNAPVAVAGATIDIYGKKGFARLDGDSDLMPFSPDGDEDEYSGNQAIVTLAYSKALSSDKKKNTAQAEVERKNAYAIIERLQAELEKGHQSEQEQNTPRFNVPDMFGSGTRRGATEPGRFTV